MAKQEGFSDETFQRYTDYKQWKSEYDLWLDEENLAWGEERRRQEEAGLMFHLDLDDS